MVVRRFFEFLLKKFMNDVNCLFSSFIGAVASGAVFN